MNATTKTTRRAFRTFQQNEICLGRQSYRATTDGQTVNLQERDTYARAWKTMGSLPLAQFEEIAKGRTAESHPDLLESIAYGLHYGF